MNEFKRIKRFGIKIEILSFLCKVFSKLKFKESIQILLYNKKNLYISKWLEKNYKNLIDKYKNEKNTSEENKGNIIWILWWQGIEKAPDLVKLCINSIKNTAKNMEVIVVTQDNYKEYINIPKKIIEKVEKGKITKTFFSDYIRMKLLSEYGGYWMDSTIFMTKNIFENIQNKEFYTLKLDETDFNNKKMISKGKWCIFFIGGSKNNLLFLFVSEFLTEYIIKEEFWIDYFLTDNVINLAYENIYEVKNMIDSIPCNNEKIFELSKIMNARYDKELFDSIKQVNDIHKLSYKEENYCYDKNGNITFYGKVLKGNE